MFGLAGLKYGQVYSYPDGKLDSLDWEKDSMRPTRSEIELMSAFDDLDGWGEELGVTISAAELSDFFGGSVSLWSNWLRENAAELKKDWDTLIFDDIDDRVIEMGAPFNKGTQQGG
jgi:S-formylglutathione hydrolase FrmB